MSEPMSDLFQRATQNVGNPPHAEAYCRVLAMEIERLAREDERMTIAKQKAPGPGEENHYALPHFDGLRFEVSRIIKMIQEAKKDTLVITTARKIAALATTGRKIRTDAERRLYTLRGIHAWCKRNFKYVDDPAHIELIQTPNRMLRELKIPPQLHMAMWKPIAKDMGGKLPPPVIVGDSDEAATLVLALAAAVGFDALSIRFGGTDHTIHYAWGGVRLDGKLYQIDALHERFNRHHTTFQDEMEIPL
jgi:hypothetical protein